MSSKQSIDTESSNTNNDIDEKKESEVPNNVDNEFPQLTIFLKHKFETPTKRIGKPSDIPTFQQSPAFIKLNTFLQNLALSVERKKISDNCYISSTTKKVLKLLDKLDKLVDDTPAISQNSRYGNKSYRTWHEKLGEKSPKLLLNILPDSWIQQSENTQNIEIVENTDNENIISVCKNPIINGIITELNGYLLSSFGDRTRIDYGTGHELTFICFLLILFELKLFHYNPNPTQQQPKQILKIDDKDKNKDNKKDNKNKNLNIIIEDDFQAIVLKIFHRYLLLMRKIQGTYFLEPAGSRGVWGLDDYQFLSFYFGASQLINHPTILPKDILNNTILKVMSHEYLYLECIQFILKMKTGIFAEHSPLLNDITSVPFWHKVKSGLYKMYQDDVIKKFPVIQHFLFGSILSINLSPVVKSQNEDEDSLLQRKLALINKLNQQRGVSDDRATINPNTNTNATMTTTIHPSSMMVSPNAGMTINKDLAPHFIKSGNELDTSNINGSIRAHYVSNDNTNTNIKRNSPFDEYTKNKGNISGLKSSKQKISDKKISNSKGMISLNNVDKSKPISMTAAPWGTSGQRIGRHNIDRNVNVNGNTNGNGMKSKNNGNDNNKNNSKSGGNKPMSMTKAPWAK